MERTTRHTPKGELISTYCQKSDCKNKGKEITEFKEVKLRRKMISTFRGSRVMDWEYIKICMDCFKDYKEIEL